jgi:hypothetical protein
VNTDGHESTRSGSGDGVVLTSNGFYELLDYEGSPDILPDANVENGLVAAGSSGAIILAGTVYGPIALRLEIYADAPPAPSPVWEEVVDVDQYTPTGVVSVNSPFMGEPTGFPALEVPPGSWYRIRVHARNRAVASAYVVAPDEPVEHHLIQMWSIPSPGEDAEWESPTKRIYRHLRSKSKVG